MFMEPWRADDDPMPLMIVDDVAIVDGFEPLHFMVEPMVQLMYLMSAWSIWWWSPCTWQWPWGHVGVDMSCLVDMMYMDGDDFSLITWPCLAHLMEMTCIDVMVAWRVSAMLSMTYMMEMTWWHDIYDGDLIFLVMRIPLTLLTLSFIHLPLR